MTDTADIFGFDSSFDLSIAIIEILKFIFKLIYIINKLIFIILNN